MSEDRVLTTRNNDESRRLVLVVDDEPMMRLLARESLEATGFQVAEAADGGEALEACREHQPRIVLLDVNMPRMDGFEACRRLRDEGWLAADEAVVLFNTGSGRSFITDWDGKAHREDSRGIVDVDIELVERGSNMIRGNWLNRNPEN